MTSEGSARRAIIDVVVVLAVAAVAWWGARARAGPLPPGFSKQVVATGLNQPIALEFLPDGRLLIAERLGRVVVRRADGTQATALYLPGLLTERELGLLGIAADPGFESNRFVYLFFVRADGRSRIGRFVMSGDVIDPGSEVVIWTNPQVCEGVSHHGGCMRFLPDATLVVSVGEEFLSSWAQDLGSPRGKILRMHTDGSVPADNPFVLTPEAYPYVYALGFRNPFRISVHPETHELYVGDVGASVWEEVSLIRPGDNAGWPFMEGPQCLTGDCSAFTGPVWSYRHDDTGYSSNGQAAVVLGPAMCADMFPNSFHGDLLVADYVNGWLKRLHLNAQGQVASEHAVLDFSSMKLVADMHVGPEGALYYARIYEGPPLSQVVYRMLYTQTPNVAPVAVASASPAKGGQPLFVRFTGSSSYDPDSGPVPLDYAWDFGDGASSKDQNPTHLYGAAGTYWATLTVSDGELTDTALALRISVGDEPEVTIDAPVEGLIYRAGDSIAFSGSAVDATDGLLPPSALSWECVLVHHTHEHPFFGPLDGVSSGSFTIPDSGHPPEHTFYRLRLTATDSNGHSVTAEREIHPDETHVHVDSEPAGVAVIVDSEPRVTPAEVGSVVDFRHTIVAPLAWRAGPMRYTFSHWESWPEPPADPQDPTLGLVAQEDEAGAMAVYAGVCAADYNSDGTLDAFDYDDFVAAYFEHVNTGAGFPDYNEDGSVDAFDYDDFVSDFFTGCAG